MAAEIDIALLNPARALPPEIGVELHYLDLADKYPTHVFTFLPPAGAPRRAPVLYVHGIQSHPGWFVGSACHLAARGHRVYCVTRRGSGANPAARGDTPSVSRLLDDLVAACRMAADEGGEERREKREGRGEKEESREGLRLVGISWGGKLLTAALAAGMLPQAVSLTLIAPGLVPRVDVPLGTKLRIAAARLLRPSRLFDIPLSDVELFTDNPSMQQYLRSDPYRLHRATARFLVASRTLDRCIARAPRGSLGIPTTLILAQTDRIIDNARTRDLVDRLTDGRAGVIELPGCHTLEFEAEPVAVYEAIDNSLIS